MSFLSLLYNSFCQTLALTYFIQLFGQELLLDWIIFHDVLVTSRVYVRTVCPIRYEWVKDLLPKLHEIDVYELSSVAREEVTDEEMELWEKKETAKRQAGAFEEGEHFDVVKLSYFCKIFCVFKQKPQRMRQRSWKSETMKALSLRLALAIWSENSSGCKERAHERIKYAPLILQLLNTNMRLYNLRFQNIILIYYAALWSLWILNTAPESYVINILYILCK